MVLFYEEGAVESTTKPEADGMTESTSKHVPKNSDDFALFSGVLCLVITDCKESGLYQGIVFFQSCWWLSLHAISACLSKHCHGQFSTFACSCL